ncbi:hypothetical protein [Emticicia sp. 17c]|uniref:hypothetical protein n=1 Tax=Emticicia sp. 17c TaxID=3127704 RepID=UPI00301D7F8D
MKTNTKKLMKAIVVVIAIIASSTINGFAQSNASAGKVSTLEKVSNLNIQNLGGLRFKLTFENPSKQKAQVYLLDKDRTVFYNEYTSGNAVYLKAFNLSNLVDGEYTFVVETAGEKITQNFVIRTEINRDVTLARNR